MTEQIYLKYVGKDKGVLPGVPARNLTYEEAKKHDIVKLVQSGLYIYAFENAISEEVKEVLPIEEQKEPPKKKRRVKHGE